MELYHASKEIVRYPEIRKAKYTKDFSWGFYCTNNMEQAIRWANRGMGEPIINYYEYKPNKNLNILNLVIAKCIFKFINLTFRICFTCICF